MKEIITIVRCDWPECAEGEDGGPADADYSFVFTPSESAEQRSVDLCTHHMSAFEGLGEPTGRVPCPEPGCDHTSPDRRVLSGHTRYSHGKGLKAYK